MKAEKCIEEITKCGAISYYSKKKRVIKKNINKIGRLMNYARKVYGGYPA